MIPAAPELQDLAETTRARPSDAALRDFARLLVGHPALAPADAARLAAASRLRLEVWSIAFDSATRTATRVPVNGVEIGRRRAAPPADGS